MKSWFLGDNYAIAPRCAKYKLILYSSISQCDAELPARLAAQLNSVLTQIWQIWRIFRLNNRLSLDVISERIKSH